MELIDQEIAEDELAEDRAARLMQEDALGPRRTREGRPSTEERQAEGPKISSISRASNRRSQLSQASASRLGNPSRPSLVASPQSKQCRVRRPKTDPEANQRSPVWTFAADGSFSVLAFCHMT
jgi:hypothetical protein